MYWVSLIFMIFRFLLAGFWLLSFLCVEVAGSEMPNSEFVKGISYVVGWSCDNACRYG
ncbi:hypothetical protein FQZ97_887900 [compost metagenome]